MLSILFKEMLALRASFAHFVVAALPRYSVFCHPALENKIKFSPSLEIFKTNINNQIRPKPSSFCCGRNKYGMKLLTQIRVDFSDLRDHRFDHKFNCTSPLCSCGMEDETSTHFLLCCPRYQALRCTYLGKISQIINSDI